MVPMKLTDAQLKALALEDAPSGRALRKLRPLIAPRDSGTLLYVMAPKMSDNAVLLDAQHHAAMGDDLPPYAEKGPARIVYIRDLPAWYRAEAAHLAEQGEAGEYAARCLVAAAQEMEAGDQRAAKKYLLKLSY